jgi:hypothetical protein
MNEVIGELRDLESRIARTEVNSMSAPATALTQP